MKKQMPPFSAKVQFNLLHIKSILQREPQTKPLQDFQHRWLVLCLSHVPHPQGQAAAAIPAEDGVCPAIRLFLRVGMLPGCWEWCHLLQYLLQGIVHTSRSWRDVPVLGTL